MKILEIITESKTQRAEAPKPRNFVAKNAKMGGAGQHKDKKKALKQGDTKHKAKQFAESHVDEISDKGLDNYRRQAHYAVQGHKFGSKKDEPNAAAIIAKREKGMQQAADKIIARKKAEEKKRLAVLVAKLPELKAEYEQMQAKYKSLGGSNWQYADREQNLSASEREARSMEGPMNNLWRQISAAEKAQKDGIGESKVTEKAVSKAQQKFMGMVYAAKKGEKPASPEVAKVAKGMTKKAAHDYAATKHKGKPDHVGESATAGSTSAGNMAVGAVYPNKKGKTYKNKDGTVKNALDVKGANLMTGGSIKR